MTSSFDVFAVCAAAQVSAVILAIVGVPLIASAVRALRDRRRGG